MEGLATPVFAPECLACMEPCTRLDHLGWLRYLASQTPGCKTDRSQAARRRVRFGFRDPIIEQQINQSFNQLAPKPLPSCDAAFASNWSILARALDGFFFPPSVLASKSNVRLGIPERLSIQHCNVWSDFWTLAPKRLASTVPRSSLAAGVLLPSHHSTIWRSI